MSCRSASTAAKRAFSQAGRAVVSDSATRAYTGSTVLALVGAGVEVPDTLGPSDGVVGVVTLTCFGAQAAVSKREAAKTKRRMVIYRLAANHRTGWASAAFG